MNSRWLRAVAAIALGGGLALAGPALPAVASHSPSAVAADIEVGDEATLIAKGAGIIVPVEVTCAPDGRGFVSVQVSQVRGRDVNTGFGFTEVACEGTTQVVEVFVPAQGGAFKNGTALVRAELFACGQDFQFCEQDEDIEEVSVSRSRRSVQ